MTSVTSYEATDVCRACGAGDLQLVLDLGEQPLANAYLVDPEARHPRYPLAVAQCGRCSLAQLTGTVDPGAMFDDYLYFSSYSDTAVDSARRCVAALTDRWDLGPHSLAMEIASNDGYLLRHYLDRDVPVLGIEPAANIAAVAAERGVTTVNEYFTTELARRLVADGRSASVLHANNVMAHVPDINDFVGGMAEVLAADGTAVVESPYVVRLVDEWQFDTVYHEHVFYYSLTALSRLVEAHGLVVVNVESLPIHGGSIRYYLRRAPAAPAPRVTELLEEERHRGVDRPEFFGDLQKRVLQLRTELRATLAELKGDGATIAAYGAAAKGTVLLNHFDIDRTLIDFVVDRNEHKQGRHMPGVGIPILPVEALVDRAPEVTVILAWNFADEIMSQQQAYRDAGGRFLMPAPTVQLL